ncbi:YcjF family protein [Cyanobium sp. LEGE 06113]|nr:YcjF family protein [Cyanobium sp. LEGE 06113]
MLSSLGRRWWPLGAAVVTGGVVLDGVAHLSSVPVVSAGTGVAVLAAGWWLLRRPAPLAVVDPGDVAGWLKRLEAMQEQFRQLEDPGAQRFPFRTEAPQLTAPLALAEASPMPSTRPSADLQRAADRRAHRRALALDSQRALLERSGLTLGVAATLECPQERQPLLAQALRGSVPLTLQWSRPLPSWSDSWTWPEPLASADALIYWLRMPLGAADLRWIEALPPGLPTWLLVEHDEGSEPAALAEELKAQLPLGPAHNLLFWSPQATSLQRLLAPLATQLGRRAAALRHDRQLRGLRNLHDRWQVELEALRRQRFISLQQRTQWLVAAGVVAAPLPSLDLVVLAVANGLMLQEMARLWQCPWTAEQLRAAALELGRASLALGVVEWSTQMLASLIKLHGATWLVGSAIQALSAAYLTRVVGRAMADMLALSAGVTEPDLQRIKREAPLLVARAAEAEKLDWSGFLQQGQQWWRARQASSASA